MHSGARHIICAYRLPGVEFHNLQDYYDDGEHGGGEFLLKMLSEADIYNRVIFVVHEYDGSHIGKLRFDAMEQAVKAAIIKEPFNPIMQEHQYPWDGVKLEGFRSTSAVRGNPHGFRSNPCPRPFKPSWADQTEGENAWDSEFAVEDREEHVGEATTQVQLANEVEINQEQANV